MEDPMSELLIERGEGTLRITINVPERLNSITTDMVNQISDELDNADGVRVAVITGVGRAFCSGAVMAPGAANAEILQAADRLIHTMTQAPFPIVAAVNGLAAGIGSSIALACDVQVTKDSDYFLQAFINVGLMPDGAANELLAASIGRTRALKLLLLGEKLPNVEGERLGLITYAVPEEEWQPLVDKTVETFATGPTRAYAATKQAVNAASLSQLSETLKRETVGQTELGASADFEEGVAAFVGKRKANFTGK
jgi:enoyl-CoA hydratase